MSFAILNNLRDRISTHFKYAEQKPVRENCGLNGRTVKIQDPEGTAVGVVHGRVVPGTRTNFGYTPRSNYYSVITPSRSFTAISGAALGVALLICAVALLILGMA